MIYLNQYSVRISPGREVSDGYVIMKHGDIYTITLRNARGTKCDAEIFIAGNSVGKWRIDAYRSITLERPARDDGKFTFYKIGTSEFHEIGGQYVSRDLQGLIEVVFTPEKVHPISNFNTVYSSSNTNFPSWTNYRGSTNNSGASWTADSSEIPMASVGPAMDGPKNMSVSFSSMVPGETGLSGHSNQVFGEVPGLDYDFENQIRIRVRLVVDTGGPRPLVSRSNPIPPPV